MKITLSDLRAISQIDSFEKGKMVAHFRQEIVSNAFPAREQSNSVQYAPIQCKDNIPVNMRSSLTMTLWKRRCIMFSEINCLESSMSDSGASVMDFMWQCEYTALCIPPQKEKRFSLSFHCGQT